MSAGPVDFDGWRARPATKLTATTSNPEGWGAVYRDALAVLGDPTKAPEPTTVRALAIGACMASAWLRNQIVDGEGGALIAQTGALPSGGARPANTNPPDAEHENAARILERSIETIVIARCPAPQSAEPLRSPAILAPSGAIEARGWPQIVVITAVAAVIGYAVHKAADVAERWAEERGRTSQLENNHATTAELVRKHVEREREAGKPLPLDEATRLALTSLGAEQAATAARISGPRNVVNVGDSSIGTIVLLVAAAGAAFAMSSR